MENLNLKISVNSCIDRLRTSSVLISKDTFVYIRDQMKVVSSIQEKHINKGKIRFHRTKGDRDYVYALNYTLGPNQQMARLEVGSFMVNHKKGEKFNPKNLRYYLVWELWPHRLCHKELGNFHNVLDELFTKLDIHDHPPIYSYEHAYLFAKVKYLEIYADFPRLEPNSFIPWKPRGSKSRIWTDPKTGEKVTTYLGPKSVLNNQFIENQQVSI